MKPAKAGERPGVPWARAARDNVRLATSAGIPERAPSGSAVGFRGSVMISSAPVNPAARDHLTKRQVPQSRNFTASDLAPESNLELGSPTGNPPAAPAPQGVPGVGAGVAGDDGGDGGGVGRPLLLHSPLHEASFPPDRRARANAGRQKPAARDGLLHQPSLPRLPGALAAEGLVSLRLH